MRGNRFIAFADILGFRDLLTSTPLEQIAARITALLHGVTSTRIGWLTASIDGTSASGQYQPGYAHFSDTIILWTESLPDFQDLQRFATGFMFTHAVATVVARAFISGIPLRVGIAFGDTYVDTSRNIVIGQPFVDAYLLEKEQEWVGGAFHASVPANCVQDRGSAVPYPVPLKRPMPLAPCGALDWVFFAAATFTDQDLTARNRELLDAAFEAYLASATAPDIRQKYLNAQQFYESRRLQLSNQ